MTLNVGLEGILWQRQDGLHWTQKKIYNVCLGGYAQREPTKGPQGFAGVVNWSRCRCGTFFTLSFVVYGIVMIFMLGRYYQESVSVMQVKGTMDTVDNPDLDKYTANGVKSVEPKPSGGVKVDNNMNVPQESKNKDSAPKTSQYKKAAKKPKAGSSVTKVIILTYMRSGSSLTGDLIQQHPDVFYVYEPLWQTQHNYLDGQPVTYLDGRVETDIDPGEYWAPGSMSIRVLQFIGNCQFQLLDIGTLMQYHMHSSESTRPFRKCHKKQINAKKTNAIKVLESCMSTVRDPCENASVIAIKVIRLKMIQLEQILIRDPDVKVIHLVRDPRGSLKSQSEMGQFEWQNLDNAVEYHCRTIAEDLTLSKGLNRRFPKRILLVRYEEIAEHPQAAAEYLYNFIGLKLTDNIRKYIWKITSAGNPPNCDICTTRSNSKETAYKWRDKMSYEDAKLIQDTCSEMFDIVGYRPFQSKEELVNRNITPWVADFGKGYTVMTHSEVQKIADNRKG